MLALGILAWAVCFPFGLAAWTMGAADLRAMRDGEMDPQGAGLTRTGLWLGAANVLLSLLGMLFLFMVAVAALNN